MRKTIWFVAATYSHCTVDSGGWVLNVSPPDGVMPSGSNRWMTCGNRVGV